MKRVLAEFLVECLQNMGEDAQIYKNYSGRGMFGKTTYGVTCSNPMRAADALLHAYQEADEDDISEFNERMEADNDGNHSDYLSFDNLGMEYIVY